MSTNSPAPQNTKPETPAQGPARLALPHVLLGATCPALGTVLHLVGHMPTNGILCLLGGCAAISAATSIVVTGGRRLAEGLATATAHGLLKLTEQQN
ncbi:hypothetical protein ACIP46_39980 [Streptomyces lavendulae]|uniref:hypothetical protein n=1 Tax=Streptomyces lavendulae TaxID=1914 RepID=UPI00380B9B25